MKCPKKKKNGKKNRSIHDNIQSQSTLNNFIRGTTGSAQDKEVSQVENNIEKSTERGQLKKYTNLQQIARIEETM